MGKYYSLIGCEKMKNIKLTIEFDGTNYAGWQRQKNINTVQETMEKAISDLTGENTELIGSSRTDAGVHARGFVANFKTDSSIPAIKFREALNCRLPDDIIILSSEEMPLDFHARYSSKGKKYSYTILNRWQPAAINRNYIYHIKSNLDVASMMEASKYFIGTHDFSAFRSTGSSVKTTERTIYESEVIMQGDKIIYIVHGNGFLYNMVRTMVGTLLNVGLKKNSPEDIKYILLSKDRSKAGQCVPGCGLCLEEVYY